MSDTPQANPDAGLIPKARASALQAPPAPAPKPKRTLYDDYLLTALEALIVSGVADRTAIDRAHKIAAQALLQRPVDA